MGILNLNMSKVQVPLELSSTVFSQCLEVLQKFVKKKARKLQATLVRNYDSLAHRGKV